MSYLFRVFFTLSFLFFLIHTKGQIKSDKPNILIILSDDQGYHDVGYYGTKDLKTPNIDALREDGIRMDNFYSNSPVCSPSRASIMSGKYPDMVGVPGLIRSIPNDNWGFLDPNAILLPEFLKSKGYTTGIIGKWNLGLESPNLPNERGFDYFHGFLDDMMEDYYTHVRNGKNFMRENYKVIEPKGHATDLFSDWAVEFIHKNSKEASPFFLYLAYNAPHFPVQPPQEWLRKVITENPGIEERRAKLVALIEHMDYGIGNVVKALKEDGIYDNTFIMFLSDNGGHLEDGSNNGPVRDGKESMYQGGLKVPAIIVWKGHIIPAAISKQVSLTMDIFPTIVDLIKEEKITQLDGLSILPNLLNSEANISRGPLFFTRREGNPRFGGLTIDAVIKGNKKLLKNSPFKPYELYDIYRDPLETRDLSRINLEDYKELFYLMQEHIRLSGSVPWEKPSK